MRLMLKCWQRFNSQRIRMRHLAMTKPQWVSMAILISSWYGVQVVDVIYADTFSITQLIIGQGLLAALITYCLSLPYWWILINAGFPLLIFYATALHFPALVYLAALVGLLISYGVVFLTRVPYYPSHQAVREWVESWLPQESEQHFLDIGSGLGGLCFQIAKHRPSCHVVGIEIAPLLWFFSRLRAKLQRKSCQFIYGDYQQHDLQQYHIVFAYLSPAAMPALWQQACLQMRPNSLLISCEFMCPEQSILPVYSSCQRGGRPVYVWQMNANSSLQVSNEY